MRFWAALLLADCVFVGVGLTYLTQLRLRIEERVAYGAVIGFVLVTLSGFVAGMIAGGLSAPVVLAAASVATAISGLGWRTGIGQVAAECRDFVRRLKRPVSAPESPAILLVMTAAAWAITVWILNQAYLPDGYGGVRAGHLSSWTDWQAHLIYASSFAHGENFPPELPTAYGVDRLPYHFGVDFFAAMLDRSGLSAFGGLEVSSGYLAFAFVPVLFLVAMRLFSSRAVGAVAVLVFTLFGGMGWTRFISDVREGGWSVIWNLPTDYTRHHQGNILMENAVTGNLYPQRPTLAGFSLLLIAVMLMWEAQKSGQKSGERRLFAAAGVLVGLMPLFHVYSYGVALGLGLIWCVIWAVRSRRVEWMLFAIPALALSIPVALWIEPLNTELVWGTWVTGDWLGPEAAYSADQDNLLFFWWRNTGVFLLLMLAAQFWEGTLPRAVLWGSIPVWLWFIVPNFLRVGPSHPWNNTHWFVMVILLGSLLVAAVLVRLASFGVTGLFSAVVLVFFLTISGALDVWKAVDPEVPRFPQPLTSSGGIAVAEWARDNTPADSVFLVSYSHTHPVPALSGRQIVVGRAGWINDLGVTDWGVRYQHARTMLAGWPGTEELLEAYEVDYVVVGPLERATGVNESFWQSRGLLEFSQGDYAIYSVRHDDGG